jgi:hypothetical protein
MDKRTLQRLREHKELRVRDVKNSNVFRVGQVLMECSCGWSGWLAED